MQVTKGPIGTKGPRITTNISLAGRYLVLMPFSDQCGISRKIEDPKERQRLRHILTDLDLPDGMAVIIRTVGEGQKARFFVRDLHVLLEQWRSISGDLETARAPKLLLAEPDLIERTVRDFLTDEVDRIVVDDIDAANRMKELVGVISKRLDGGRGGQDHGIAGLPVRRGRHLVRIRGLQRVEQAEDLIHVAPGGERVVDHRPHDAAPGLGRARLAARPRRHWTIRRS